MPNRLTYNFRRLFWSIYFALTIGAIGLLFGYVTTLSIFLVAFLLTPFPRLSDRVRYLGEYVQCYSIRLLLRLQPWLKCQTNLHGIYGFYDQFQTRKVLFVANHRSNLDTFLLISYIPGLRGLAKSTLFYNVFFAPFMYLTGFIPVEKGSPKSFINGLKDLRDKLLKRDRPVLIFPENTRCDKGYPSVRKFSSAVFSIAIESGAVIVPLTINSTDQLMGRGDLLLNPYAPVSIQMLQPIQASQYKDSQALCDRVWDLIQAGVS